MKHARLSLLALWIAILFAILEGGAPRILCVGAEGHAAVEETLCGSFDTGATSCSPKEQLASRAACPEGPCELAGEQGDRCTDTVLQSSALTAPPPNPSAPGPFLLPPVPMLPPCPSGQPRACAGFPFPDPPVPIDTHTTLLI
jgi:hypothetical protein